MTTNIELAMRKAFADAAEATCHVSDTAPIDEDEEAEHSDYSVKWDDGLGINEDHVLDIVETRESRLQRRVLQKAGWLKKEGEDELRRTEADLVAERRAGFTPAVIRRIRKGETK